jgi:hypothetical protein
MFGAYDGFPLTFGGEDFNAHEVEHQALLDAYAPGWDKGEDTENYAECWAYANAIAMIWAVNERVRNQAIPGRMLEAVAVWEEALQTRPTSGETDQDRRARIAAKLRGLANNAISDIGAVCTEIFGANFDSLVVVEPANQTTYWPGVNPGPPGWEWSSNRCRIGVRVTKTGLEEERFLIKRTALADALFSILPAWMDFTIGVGTSWVVNQGVVGQTFI